MTVDTPLPSAHGQRAYEGLAALLRQRIVSGEMPDGARLPTETSLATSTRVSRSTVREALRTLEEEGYIVRASPKIFVVRRRLGQRAAHEFSRAMRRVNVTLNHLYDALVLFEPEMARLAATHAGPEAIVELRRNLRDQQTHVGDYERWCLLDEEFHLQIALSSANPALIVARAPISEMMSPLFHRFPDGQAVATRAIDFHRRILAEIEERDPEAAALMMRKHVRDSRVPWDAVGIDFDRPIDELGEVVDLARTISDHRQEGRSAHAQQHAQRRAGC